MKAALYQVPTTTRRRPFKDDSHCYWIGPGLANHHSPVARQRTIERLYSLSRILRDLGLKPDYGDADPAVIQRAAHRGKLVEHYCVQMMQTGKPVTVRQKHCGSLQKDVSARVEAFWRWKEKYKPTFVAAGDYAWSLEDRVCWQEDLKVMIDGQLWLVDIKCTSQPAKDWPLQVGCGLSYDLECENAAILHLSPKLNKDGYRFIHKWTPYRLRHWWITVINAWTCGREMNMLRDELGFETEAQGFEIEEDI